MMYSESIVWFLILSVFLLAGKVLLFYLVFRFLESEAMEIFQKIF